MTAMNQSKAAEVILLAERAVVGMKEASNGKAPESVTETNARTFANLAGIMNALVTLNRQQEVHCARMRGAMERIADLQVRSSAELLEQRNWKKLLTEVQSVARDTLDQ